MAHYPSTSVLACRVNLGGMTLAVPGATGFVAPAQRAVIGMSGSSRRPGSGTRYRDDENHVWARSARPPHVPVERSGYGTTKRGGDRRKHASFAVRYRDGSAGACNPKHAPRSGHRVGCLTTVHGVPDLTPKTSPAGSSPLGGTRARTICRMAAAALTSPAMAATNRVSCRASSRAQARGRTTLPQQCCPLW